MKRTKLIRNAIGQPIKKRITILFFSLFFVLFTDVSNAKSQSSLIFSFNNSALEKVIHFIEKNSEFRFLYKTSQVDLTKKVTLNYTGEVAKAVNILFSNTKIEPIIVNKQIILKPKLQQQERVISGKVTDANGQPLYGATVIVNEVQGGAFCDSNGKYSVAAKTGDKMLFTYIGYKDKEVVVTANSDIINVVLELDVTMIDEVLLIGYGAKNKSEVSSAISTIDEQDLENDLQSGSSFDRSLSGMVKGVRVIQGSGKPGSGVDINIRGYTSPFSDSANNPLFVIDGVPIQAKEGFGSTSSPLLSINPNDIKSMNVLKDAAATSIYGSRGANGVIIIKTKTGYKGQDLHADLSVRTTFSKPIKTLKYLDANQYKNYVGAVIKREVSKVGNLIPFSQEWFRAANELFNLTNFGVQLDPTTYSFFYDPATANYGKANTNWANTVYRSAAYTQEYNLSLRGGGERTAYGLSLRYLDQEGLLRNDNFKQYHARLNYSFSPTEKWNISANVNLGTTNNTSGYIGVNGDLNGLLSARPDIDVYNKEGKLTTYSGIYGLMYANPLAMTTENQNNSKGKTATGNIQAEFEVLEGLKLKGALNVAHFNSNGSTFYAGEYSELGFMQGYISDFRILSTQNVESTNIVGDFTVNYQKEFNEKHNIDILAGVTRSRDYYEMQMNSYSGFANNNSRFPQYAKDTQPGRLIIQENGLNSYLARGSYSYDNKYNLTATVRLDQSSKFAPSNRNAWFPSVAASWNIHREDFIKDKEKINNLKLRLSYGNTGSTNVPSFTFIQKFVAGTTYNGQNTIGPSNTLSNPKAAWEKTSELNAGLDFGFFKHRINGSIDLYKRTTDGVLIASPYPLETGASQFTDNFAIIENKGIEADLNFEILQTDDFSWEIGINATKNINKLVDFNEDFVNERFFATYQKGKEINLIKGYVVEGIYQNQKEVDDLNNAAKAKNHPFYDQDIAPGDYKMKDVNGDGKISADDRVILGSSQPDLFGGFRSNIRYKDFTFGTSFSYSFGAETTRHMINDPIANASPHKNIEEQFAPKYRWSPDNTDAKLPRMGFNLWHNARVSSANVYDASYVRLKSVRLGYKLPYTMTEKLKLYEVSMYLSGNNLYTWTKYPGIDPEAVSGGGAFSTSTTNRDPYPISKSWTFGVNIKF